MRVIKSGLILFLLSAIFAIQLSGQESMLGGKTAPPLPAPSGEIVDVYNIDELNEAIDNLSEGVTVMIHPGEYNLTKTLRITGVENVTLRGSTGNRQDIVIRGWGMTNEDGASSLHHCIYAEKSHYLMVADLTLADPWYHCVHVVSCVGVHLYNCHFLDSGEQLVKINASRDREIYPDSGLVEYCRFEFTDRGKHWYHNGVNSPTASYWTMRDNEFFKIRGPIGEKVGPAITFFQGSRGTIAERNLFVDCDLAVGLGIFHMNPNTVREGEDTYAHRDAIIRNNIVINNDPNCDAAFVVGYSANYRIYNNTVILNGNSPRTILYGDSLSYGEIKNNIVDGPFQAASDINSIDPWSPGQDEEPTYVPTQNPDHQSTAVIENNITDATAEIFVDFEGGDLHLLESASVAVNAGVELDEVTVDYDGHTRPVGANPDIGADETSSQALRGDYNHDGMLNIVDVITLILWYYNDFDREDVDYNGDGKYNISDAIALILDIQ